MAETETALHNPKSSMTAANIRTVDRDAEIEIDLGELFLRLLDKDTGAGLVPFTL